MRGVLNVGFYCSTESTNLGGGLRQPSVLFFKMLIYLWNILYKLMLVKCITRYKRYSLHMIMYCTWTSHIHILVCHTPIMDNPENNQHFNELI